MTEKDTSSYKDCKYFCYGRYCKYFYEMNKKKYGWDDLTEYMCIKHGPDICPLFANIKKCKLYTRKSLIRRLFEKIFKKVI